MRIAIVTNLFPPVQTGTSYWAKELAINLAQRGHIVVVITCRVEGTVDEEIADGIAIYRLPSWRLPSNPVLMNFDQFYMGYSSTNKRRIREILVAHQIEVVHQCGHLLDFTYMTPRVCDSLDIPAVCSVHSIIHFPNNRLVNQVMETLDNTFVKHLAMALYTTVIALDSEVKTYVHNRYQHPRIRVVCPCLEANMLNQPAVQMPDHGPFKILSVGHVTSMRNRLDLIMAVHRLHQSGLPVGLTIVGKVCYTKPVNLVERLGLQDVVQFTGELPRSKIYALAQVSHLDAHWITTPGLGTAILEAMALGLPAMTYGYPGIFDGVPLIDGENIIFVEPGNVDQIASKIAHLATSPSLRNSIGQKGRMLVRDYLTWPSMISRLEDIYSEALRYRERRDAHGKEIRNNN